MSFDRHDAYDTHDTRGELPPSLQTFFTAMRKLFPSHAAHARLRQDKFRVALAGDGPGGEQLHQHPDRQALRTRQRRGHLGRHADDRGAAQPWSARPVAPALRILPSPAGSNIRFEHLAIYCRHKHRDGKPKYREGLPRFIACAHKVSAPYNAMRPPSRLLEPPMGATRMEVFG